MKRPRLTSGLLPGLTWISEMAGADLESVSTDSEYTKKRIDEIERALTYLDDLVRWHENRPTRSDRCKPTTTSSLKS